MFTLARELTNRGHKITIITPNYGAANYEDVDGVRIHRFPFPGKIREGEVTMRYRWLANPFFYLYSSLRILIIACHERIDILHAQNKYSLPGTWLAGQCLLRPVVFTVRDTGLLCPFGQCFIHRAVPPPDCGSWHRWSSECRLTYVQHYLPDRQKSRRLQWALTWLWLDSIMRKAVLDRIDGIVGVSRGILSVFRTCGRNLSAKARVIYNLPPRGSAVSSEALLQWRRRLRLEDEQKTVLFAGRFSLGKGVQDLLDAAPLVQRVHPNIRFLFAGYGQIQTDGVLTKNLGHLSHEKLWEPYHVVDMVAIPSRHPEPLSRVGLESMAAGKPIVATLVGGTPELVEDGKTGILLDPGKPASLAKAIIDLLSDDQRLKAMGKAARERAMRQFHPDRTIKALVSFYEDILERAARGPVRCV